MRFLCTEKMNSTVNLNTSTSGYIPNQGLKTVHGKGLGKTR